MLLLCSGETIHNWNSSILANIVLSKVYETLLGTVYVQLIWDSMTDPLLTCMQYWCSAAVLEPPVLMLRCSTSSTDAQLFFCILYRCSAGFCILYCCSDVVLHPLLMLSWRSASCDAQLPFYIPCWCSAVFCFLYWCSVVALQPYWCSAVVLLSLWC
jgi:hypothetical protein